MKNWHTTKERHKYFFCLVGKKFACWDKSFGLHKNIFSSKNHTKPDCSCWSFSPQTTNYVVFLSVCFSFWFFSVKFLASLIIPLAFLSLLSLFSSPHRWRFPSNAFSKIVSEKQVISVIEKILSKCFKQLLLLGIEQLCGMPGWVRISNTVLVFNNLINNFN